MARGGGSKQCQPRLFLAENFGASVYAGSRTGSRPKGLVLASHKLAERTYAVAIILTVAKSFVCRALAFNVMNIIGRSQKALIGVAFSWRKSASRAGTLFSLCNSRFRSFPDTPRSTSTSNHARSLFPVAGGSGSATVSQAPVDLVSPISVSNGDYADRVVDVVEDPVLPDPKTPRGGTMQALRPGRPRVGFEPFESIVNAVSDLSRQCRNLAGGAFGQDDPVRHLPAPGIDPPLEHLKRDGGLADLLVSPLGEDLNVPRVAGLVALSNLFVTGAPLCGRVGSGSAHRGDSTPLLEGAA